MEESDIYENQTFRASQNFGPGKNLPASSEKVDAYENIYQTLEMNTAGTSLSGAQDVKRKSYRIATVCLGLLCALLLAGLIILAVLYVSKWKSGFKELPTSYKNLTNENQQLQTSLEQLTSWRNDLHRRLQAHGWVYFNTSLYYVSSLTGSWNEGRADCQSRGADLMIFNSGEEKDFAKSLQNIMWVGLTNTETPGTWKWLDGTPLDKSYWAPGRPRGTTEHCAATYRYWQNSLFDLWCNMQYNWICEQRFDL